MGGGTAVESASSEEVEGPARGSKAVPVSGGGNTPSGDRGKRAPTTTEQIEAVQVVQGLACSRAFSFKRMHTDKLQVGCSITAILVYPSFA